MLSLKRAEEFRSFRAEVTSQIANLRSQKDRLRFEIEILLKAFHDLAGFRVHTETP